MSINHISLIACSDIKGSAAIHIMKTDRESKVNIQINCSDDTIPKEEKNVPLAVVLILPPIMQFRHIFIHNN